MELYTRLKPVKEYYDFVFNPKEEKLLEEAKIRIRKEYFPQTKRRPKMRRSVAQKLIKHYLVLGVDVSVIAEVMLYNLEVAILYSGKRIKQGRRINSEPFYKSMFNHFSQVISFAEENGLTATYKERMQSIVAEIQQQDWHNRTDFTERLAHHN